MPSFYVDHEERGGPGKLWFNQSVTARALSDDEIHRARLFCAAHANDADELREFLGMLGLEDE